MKRLTIALSVAMMVLLVSVTMMLTLSADRISAATVEPAPIRHAITQRAQLAPTGVLTPMAWLPFVMRRPPAIWFTYVPPIGSHSWLCGAVASYISPSEYDVAVYINVAGGWWTKPYWNSPLTPIGPDRTWCTDITTGGYDDQAGKIAAFLVRKGYTPPPGIGQTDLPDELYDNAFDYVITERTPTRYVQFSGYTWMVKAADFPAGPDNNYFSDSPSDVWVDAQGRLHLSIVYRDGQWRCTEVVMTQPLGYGTYTFTLASRVDLLDRNVVLGMFTWDGSAPLYHYREIDVEMSRWGETTALNAQFVVQPWDHPGNRHRFPLNLTSDYSTHRFTWRADQVQFASFQGHDPAPPPSALIEAWTYTGPDVPPAGAGNARINLWLQGHTPPSDGLRAEVIVESFKFAPLGN